MPSAPASLCSLLSSSSLDPPGPGWCLVTMGDCLPILLFKMSRNYQAQAAGGA